MGTIGAASAWARTWIGRRAAPTVAVVLAALVVSAGAPAAGSGPTAAGERTQTDPPAFPTFVHLPADQAAHPGAGFEWWYTVGHLTAFKHQFGYEVQIVGGPAPQTELAITDQTTGQYFQQVTYYQPSQVSMSTSELNLRTPQATLSGPMDAMSLHATLPEGRIDLLLRADGPAIYDNGTGLMPFLGGASFYYSLPRLATVGTITESGKTYVVSGVSWLDRQWGSWNFSRLQRWTWMALQLDNGVSIDLWDLFSNGGENAYATVLRPDGSLGIVAITPVAGQASSFWVSPTTGQRYATHWVVTIPGLDARLTVDAHPQQQEIQTNGGIFEGASSVTGMYGGRPTAGGAYVEQFGDWRSGA